MFCRSPSSKNSAHGLRQARSFLYVGDTALKHMVYAEVQLKKIGVPITEHVNFPT